MVQVRLNPSRLLLNNGGQEFFCIVTPRFHHRHFEALVRSGAAETDPSSLILVLPGTPWPQLIMSISEEQEGVMCTAGISPLDVWPYSWKHVNGYEEEIEYRKAKLEVLREAGHLFLPFEQRIDVIISPMCPLINLTSTVLSMCRPHVKVCIHPPPGPNTRIWYLLEPFGSGGQCARCEILRVTTIAHQFTCSAARSRVGGAGRAKTEEIPL
jgi:hypothetical protein